MKLMKLYTLIFHQFSGLYLGGGIILATAAHFKKSQWFDCINEASTRTKYMAYLWPLLFIPFIFIASKIYPWQSFHGSRKLYFNSFFILLRTCIYIIGCFWATLYFKRLPSLTLIIFLFIGSFFSIDWAMSLEPRWSSNLYCFIYLINGALGFLSFFVFMKVKNIKSEIRIDFAHLLLTLSMLGIYLHFSQYIITWMGNRPRDVVWYLDRRSGGKTFLISFVYTLKLLPVIVICFKKEWKTDVRLMRGMSLGIVLGYLFEVIWLIGPSL